MKGILYTEPNFRLTLERKKTNTRREVPESTLLKCDKYEESNEYVHGNNALSLKEFMLKHARYKVGEKVFLKEPYRVTHIDNTWFANYKYTGEKKEITVCHGNEKLNKIISQQSKSKSGWCNKMFMPSWMAKHFIEITDVKCERLQDISDNDCIAEGIDNELPFGWAYYDSKKKESGGMVSSDSPKEAYKGLWESINGKGSWDENPWVYSYHYKLLFH